jgi:tetratricopeptide (TPR) repeat protein
VRRPLIFSVGLACLLVGALAAGYLVRQEREFQRLIATGDRALAQNETFGAIEAFSGALALKDDSMLAHLRRGDAYRRRGELTEALRDLQQAVALDPSAPAPVELSGDVNAAMGRYDQAAEALKEALALNGQFAEAQYLLGLCLREQSNVEEARQALTRALELSPTFAAAREELVELYDSVGRRREAIEQLEALATLEPNRPARLVSVGRAYARWGRTDAAILTLARAAERFPGDPAVRTALGQVWLAVAAREDDPAALKKAVAALQPMTISSSTPTDALVVYGEALLRSGDTRAAEQAFVEAATRRPVDPVVFRHLGDAAERLGHRAAARDALLRYAALVGEDRLDRQAADQLSRLQ